MKTGQTLVILIVALCVGAVLAYGLMRRRDLMPLSKVGGEVQSGLGGEIVQVTQSWAIVAALPGVVVGSTVTRT